MPTIYVRLLETPAETAREIGASMRLFVSGSAPLPAQVLEEFRARFGHTILERYGMSETLMNISNPYVGRAPRRHAWGLPLPGVSVDCWIGSRRRRNGRVYIRAPTSSPATGGARKPRARPFVDGWFRTGDLAVRSADGYYTLRGRKSDLIISGGFNIYPREIEEFLQEQDEVAEAAVVGVPDRVAAKCRSPTSCCSAPIDAAELEAPLPRETGLVQSAARVHAARKTAAQRAGKGAEAPAARP